MYKLDPPALFAHRRVLDSPDATARLQRIVNALGRSESDVTMVTHEDMDLICEASNTQDTIADERIIRGGHGRYRMGWLESVPDPVLLFSTFVWDPEERVKPERRFLHPQAHRAYRMLCGVGNEYAFGRRELVHGVHQGGYVCQGGYGIHSFSGCLHKCDYCSEGLLDTVQLDLDNLADACRKTFAERPEQKLYRWDVMGDTVTFEPEYGGTETIGGAFNETDDKVLLLYTKSDNTDHVLDFDYRDHVAINWTISTETVCREIEKHTPSLDARIAAMRRCQEGGYQVRAGFSPIIPVRNWREEATDMLERLFAQVEPDVLRLWVVSMMDAYEAETIWGEAMLDPYCLRRALEEAPTMDGTHPAPFPTDVRAMIYEYYLDEIHRLRPHLPVALCTERPEVWELLQPKLQMVPTNMFCCCGGTSVPGGWHGPLT